jgi:hypothetical protein
MNMPTPNAKKPSGIGLPYGRTTMRSRGSTRNYSRASLSKNVQERVAPTR